MKASLKVMAHKSLQRLAQGTGISQRLASLHFQMSHLQLLSEKLTSRIVSMGPCKASQILLALRYQELARQHQPLPRFDEAEFRVFSQNGEDGILLYIFSLIGTTNKKAVEICAGTCIECNTANLVVNHGWRGLLVDGDPCNLAKGQAFYAQCGDTCIVPPALAHAWITAENVNDLVGNHRFGGEIDLLSVDIDGNDFWVWKALNCVRPRVVVVEFNTWWGPQRSVTIPYDPDFRVDFSKHPPYCGASLAAFVKLARVKGYRLVGAQQLGFNAFFMRDGIGEQWFPEVTPFEVFDQLPRLKGAPLDPGPDPHQGSRPWTWIDV